MSHFEEPPNNQMVKMNILWISVFSHTSPVRNADMQEVRLRIGLSDGGCHAHWAPNIAALPWETSQTPGDMSTTLDHFHREKESVLTKTVHYSLYRFLLHAHNVSARKTIPELTKYLGHCYGVPLGLLLKKGFYSPVEGVQPWTRAPGSPNLTTYANP